MGHRVWVITRANNQSGIEEAALQGIRGLMFRINLQFVYYDLPQLGKALEEKKFPVVFMLTILAGRWVFTAVAKALIAQVDFDWVHHITFGGIRQPSFLSILRRIPSILGPLGGGERAPYALRKSFPLRGHVLDFLRDLLNSS